MNKHLIKPFFISLFFLLIFLLLGYNIFFTAETIEQSFVVNNFDIPLNSYINTLHGNNFINSIFIIITKSFNPEIFTIWFPALLLFLTIKKYYLQVLFIFIGVSGGQVVKMIFKALTDRTRPENPFGLSIHESSFPSGHATTAVFLSLSLLYFIYCYKKSRNNIYKISALFCSTILFFLVPFSRIYTQVHFLSDTIAGTLLGISSFFFTVFLFRAWEIYKK